jgi:hypothetical protein
MWRMTQFAIDTPYTCGITDNRNRGVLLLKHHRTLKRLIFVVYSRVLPNTLLSSGLCHDLLSRAQLNEPSEITILLLEIHSITLTHLLKLKNWSVSDLKALRL